MKNIRFFIGILALLSQLPLSIFAQPGITSDRQVTLIHGLGEPEAWIPFRNFFTGQDNRRMNIARPEYNSLGGLNAAASQIPFIGSNTVVISHSLGGLIARHINNGSNPMAGIITVGSPMDGAPIANALEDGRVNNAVSDAANQLTRGPLAQLGYLTPLLTLAGQVLRVTFLADKISENVNTTKFGGVNMVSDIKVGGSAIEQDKNAAPTNTPKISIWGNENTPVHWNILGSATGQDVAGAANSLSTIYEVGFFANLAVGAVLWYSPVGWWAFYAAYEWYNGWQWISNDSERVWNNLIGSDMVATQCYQYPSLICYYPDTRYCENHPGSWNCLLTCDPITLSSCAQVHSNGQSDAFIPITSQRGDGGTSWRTGSGQIVKEREAREVNHLEEVDANNNVMRAIFAEIFAGGIDPNFRIDRR
jgi:hypothetical protein